MYKEILFRGKCIKSGNIVSGDFIHGVGAKNGNCYILPYKINLTYVENCDPLDGVKVVPETVSQYIGVKDINDNYLFEKDIVKGRYMVQRSLDPNTEPEINYFEGEINFADGCYFVKGENGQCVFSFNYNDYEIEFIKSSFSSYDGV